MTRRRRWLILITLLFVLIIVSSAGIWWALSTNQLGRLLEGGYAMRSYPGVLHVARTEVRGIGEVILYDVSVAPARNAPAVATIKRIVVTGDLWKGNIDHVVVEGGHAHLTAESVAFINELIKVEVARKPSGLPRPLLLDITGADVDVAGEPFLRDSSAVIHGLGPLVDVDVRLLAGAQREKVWLTVSTDGKGDSRRYRIMLKPGAQQGKLVVREWCSRLATLKLLPPLPTGADPWIPVVIDASGSTVVAQSDWQHFTGDLQARWQNPKSATVSAGSAALRIDLQSLRLDHLKIRDDVAGIFDGSLEVGFVNHLTEVDAVQWHPGPSIPLPKEVPIDDVLALLPQAHMRAQAIPTGWEVRLDLSGTGTVSLSWYPGKDLIIDGVNVPLSLLQKFLPGEVTLAAGRSTKLHVEIGENLDDLSAEFEQTRVLWNGWGLGTVDGKVTAHSAPGGYDVEALLPAMGTLRYRGGATAGTMTVELQTAEALMVRLKGPFSLPDLRGSIACTVEMRREKEGMIGRVRDTRLRNVSLPDLLKDFDATIAGGFDLRHEGTQMHLLGQITLGQITRGSVRLPGAWLDLARHTPIFTAKFNVHPGVIESEDILVRAANASGQAQLDGYSAGLRGTLSINEQQGKFTGEVEHADLAWLTSTSLIAIPDGHLRGQCAVTFTAVLAKEGITNVDGFFLPLDADLILGPTLHASGITGSVKFRMARNETGTDKPAGATGQ